MIAYTFPRDLSAIEALVDQKAQENTHLDFKSAKVFGDLNKLRSELPRDASAMTNAAGGVLVFGVDEGDDSRAESISGYAENKISSQWFEDVLLTTVSPSLPGVEVVAIEHSTGVIFVVHVPQSLIAPHQANDGKYYSRRQLRRDVLEHYEIDMLRERSRAAQLDVFGGLAFDRYWLIARIDNDRSTPIYDVRFRFDGAVPAQYFKSKVFREGLLALPARSKIEFRLCSIHEAMRDPIMKSNLTYRFEFRPAPAGRIECLLGAIHLAELEGAAIGENDATEIVRALRLGFSDLATAFKRK